LVLTKGKKYMLKKVYISNTNCITPLGFDVKTNVSTISNGISGIKKYENNSLLKVPFHAAIVNNSELDAAFSKISKSEMFTKLEKMMLLALHPIIEKSALNKRTALILSTTKGNITALEKNNDNSIEKAQLHTLAKTIANFFEFKTEPIVVSNACVSGILAVSVAKRLIQSEVYDDVFVVAGDLVSEFVLSGFNSFQAMSDEPCKPYSINRNGVSLGEATAAVLVSKDTINAKVEILGDGSINDANHISGPSRTGEGLFRSIQSALSEANLNANTIDYISAHGTATPFNDEMEAIAFNRLGLQNVPVNSLKGYYGHTLGASGLLETVIGIQSLIENKLYASLGFDELGVSQSINVIKENQDKNSRTFLKTASGFGGCNTAVVFQKVE
jgi:3-oxoacyl-[acyl-carrier-protein] synthase I